MTEPEAHKLGAKPVTVPDDEPHLDARPGPEATPETERAQLVVDHVSKTFRTAIGSVNALEDISLKVNQGEFVCLVGPSGCGESTLLNIIAGIEHPDRGRVLAEGRPVTGPGRDRLVMFQESALFPWLDVQGNVTFGLKLKPGLKKADRQEVARYYLQLVGLERFSRSNVHELSGGMKQRVALARALAPNPRILLMDEPFASLDAMTREQFYGDLQEIWRQKRRTIVLVTHNVREAVCLGDRVLLFSARPGRIREEFKIDLPRPRELDQPEVSRKAAEIRAALKRHLGLDSGVRP